MKIAYPYVIGFAADAFLVFGTDDAWLQIIGMTLACLMAIMLCVMFRDDN